MKKTNTPREATVKVSTSTKDKVAKVVVGTPHTIGSFYDEAAEEKIKLIRFLKAKAKNS